MRVRTGATSQIARSHAVAPPVPRSPEIVGSSGKGVWDSGANGCDLVNYEVAPGPVAPPVPRSAEIVGSSGKGVWDSGANGCDLVHYEVAGASKLLFWSTNIVR